MISTKDKQMASIYAKVPGRTVFMRKDGEWMLCGTHWGWIDYVSVHRNIDNCKYKIGKYPR